jgi:hypothetical protein
MGEMDKQKVITGIWTVQHHAARLEEMSNTLAEAGFFSDVVEVTPMGVTLRVWHIDERPEVEEMKRRVGKDNKFAAHGLIRALDREFEENRKDE